MKNEYFDSEEFKEILDKYEASKKQGTTCYFDAEDFIDIADNYLLNEQPLDALDAVLMGLELHPDEVDLCSTRSGVLIFMHKFDEAREIIDTLPQDEGNVIYQRAQLAYAIDNDIMTAEELFGDWIESEEKESRSDSEEERDERLRDAYLHIITSFIELRGSSYDEELVKRWIEEYYARFSPLGYSDFDLILADMVRNEGLTDMVEKIYSSLLEKDPYINYGWVVLSTSQVMNGHYQEAIDSADFALAIDPDNADAILSKAHAYYSLARKDKAMPLFKRFLEKIDDANQYLPYAICLITEDRVEEAKPFLGKAEEYISNYRDQKEYYAQSYFELAQAYSAFDFEKARECVDKAVELYPKDLDYLMLQGTLYLNLNMFQESLDVFSECMSIADDKVLITCEIGLRFIMQQQYDSALQIIETAREYGKEHPSQRIVCGYIAYAYYCKQDFLPFLDNLKIACSQCPDTLRSLFYGRFPETVEPKDYYEYIINNPLFSENK